LKTICEITTLFIKTMKSAQYKICTLTANKTGHIAINQLNQ